MKTPEYYETDVQAFFEGRPAELAVYQALFRRLYAAASLPRRRKGWPERCLLLTFGLARRVESPRIAVAVEPYPNRWTHHVTVAGEAELDGELMDWLREAHDFALPK